MSKIWLDRKYAALLGSSLRNFKIKNSSPFLASLSCPICGDSASNKRKTRGYIYTKGQALFYRCHNCGHGTTLGNFIRQISPNLFQEYVVEKFRNKEEQKEIIKTKNEEKLRNEIALEALIQRVIDVPEAMAYLRSRKIPEIAYSGLFYTEDLNELKPAFTKYTETKFLQEPRLIIPIRNRQKKIIGVTSRAIAKSRLRYINMIYNEDEPLIYNLDKVDFTKKILVTEGAFDSMFLPNSMAVDGADFAKLKNIVAKDQVTLVYDHQPRNRQLIQRIKKIADDGWNICVWPSWIKKKDINEMVLDGMEPSEIAKIISNHTYEGLTLRLKLAEWIKV